MISAEAFWQYSLELYPRHQKRLLGWQDNAGVNVNIALLCCYLDDNNAGLMDIETLEQAIAASDRQLQQLRSIRRDLKNLDAEAYQHLLAAELALEKRQQQILIEHLNFKSNCSVAGNLQQYLASKGLPDSTLVDT